MRPRDDFGSQVWAWAWGRHQNLLSWYIRPFFVLPLAYFSYRRSPWGIAGTLVALATSMFWFPKPARVDPRAAEFLRMEQEYLTSGWTPAKILALPTVPLSLGAFCLAFWRRSVGYGLLVIDIATLTKVLWSVAYSKESGRAIIPIIPPALVGTLITNVTLLWAMRRAGHKLTF